MLFYCPKCQNLIDKNDESRNDGEIVVFECQKCGNETSYYIKYKAISNGNNKDLQEK